MREKYKGYFLFTTFKNNWLLFYLIMEVVNIWETFENGFSKLFLTYFCYNL